MLREARDKIARQLANMREELETAHQIQLSILPRESPKVNCLDINARFKPMAGVAGDFYDFIRVDDKRLGTLVADVSGHGMPASLISSMLKIAFAEQVEFAADPARLMAALNQTLCGKFRGHFVTAAYVFIDTEKKVLRYAGAGHPPMLMRNGSSGTVSEVIENGLFLGSFPQAVYSAVEKPFENGDWILLYTDGIVEMNDPKEEEFGIERLKGFLEKNGALTTTAFIDAALAELSHWAASKEVEDDLTLLAIRFENAKSTTAEERQ
jgi:phosphoserine phosphatase RsbU/P